MSRLPVSQTSLTALIASMTPMPTISHVAGGLPTPMPTGAEGFGNDLGVMALKMFLGLGIVCLLAVVLLRVVAPFLTGKAHLPSSQMRVIGRLGLEGRRSLLLVRIAGRTFLLGSTDGGISLLAELDDNQFADRQAVPRAASLPFADLFRKRRNVSSEEKQDGPA